MDCVRPRTVHVHGKGQNYWQKVPCGMCIACRIAKTREWTLRLLMEKSSWEKCCFITLTYDDDHLPRTGCNRPTLQPVDSQKFWKRVRRKLELQLEKDGKEVSPPLLKYFMCGEYGDT